MSTHPTEQELRRTFAARTAGLAARENVAWLEYLANTRASETNGCDAGEPFAWRRLRRALTELAQDRRLHQFNLNRELSRTLALPHAS